MKNYKMALPRKLKKAGWKRVGTASSLQIYTRRGQKVLYSTKNHRIVGMYDKKDFNKIVDPMTIYEKVKL